MKKAKHDHGTPNPIIEQEEEAMLAVVKRAVSSTSNAQVIGRNGEIPVRDFLNRYMPYTFRAATGHVVAPSGELSPQLDVMLLDARYPLLCHNTDGSVLAMLHSLVAVIEVKTRLVTKDIPKLWSDARKIAAMSAEVEAFRQNGFGTPYSLAFAYQAGSSLSALQVQYEKSATPTEGPMDIHIMRLQDGDTPPSKRMGIELHYEPPFEEEDQTEWMAVCIAKFTPLSDLYYHLVQTAYYTIGARNFDYSDIGRHVIDYMSWSTCLLTPTVNCEKSTQGNSIRLSAD